ncbi:DNA replication regulator sld2 [Grosmannia clavigera kw1407]|uniref:DNA replication regulator SLD2 n=1 Tax=Grosmannia clavigera (strain kw1407 / UAMH 11150) TaxID=655863 RepID=F0XN79_GROCL|nr:DNA replication regulator sld2 [Grosmannia clavigera kw1407]EFX00937.1 DNA replication regulator sld2 [Grosmannia clavigera kw1407]
MGTSYHRTLLEGISDDTAETMLETEERAKYEAESQQLRLDLKTWETEWARDHDGAKPGRADIKQHSEIAQKYTAYNRVRSILSGKVPPSEAAKREPKKDDSEARRKRKTEADAPAETPTKRLRPVETPQKTSTAAVADAVTPSISRRLFSPVVPTSIGPTPQRDGRVLGLFDFLAEEAGSAERRKSMAGTPSKRKNAPGKVAAATASTSAALPSQPPLFAESVATPRKQTLARYGDEDEDAEDGHRRLGRTPMSSAKRNLLDRFTAGTTSAGRTASAAADSFMIMSPLRARDANVQQGGSGQPDQDQDKQQQQQQQQPQSPLPPFATPTFLRRAPVQLSVDENGEFLSPPGRLRLPRKPLVRGLSSVLAGLRKLEDDRLDEELDVLRELEAEEAGGPPVRRTKTSEEAAPVQDGQRLLGGFDDEGLYDSAPEEQTGRDGQPLRLFKKKGQKRTTRLVYMRPTRTKRPVADATVGQDGSDFDEEDDKNDGEHEAVPLTGGGGSDDEWSDGEEQTQQAAKEKKDKDKKRDKKATAAAADGTEDRESKAGPVRRAARKVNELAHANFKRLKLRNSGSKGGPGFNSRFRRRR